LSKFLDAAYPQSVGAFVGALQHEGADSFAWYLGGNNTTHGHDWAPIVDGVTAAGYASLSVWVPVPSSSNGSADGAAAAAGTKAHGILVAGLDIEAGLAAGGRPYCQAWNAAARSAGVLTCGYSTPAGVGADEFDFDLGWAATPGNCDVGGCPMPPGRRAVQCGAGSYGGVSYDVSFADYSLGELMASLDRIQQVVDTIPAARTGANLGDLGADIWQLLIDPTGATPGGGPPGVLPAILAAVKAIPAGPGGLSPDQANQLASASAGVAALQAQLSKIEAALVKAGVELSGA
jgi:hypothetical protein